MRFDRADFVFNHVEHVEHVRVWGGAPTLPVSTCSTWFKNFPALRGLAAAFILLCSLSANALPLAWRADWPDCKPVEKLVHRGTDVELQPVWYIYGTPAASTNWTLTTYVQTNCVGQWFGPLPGAFFSHTNDVGAAFYSVMVRAETPGGSVNYTAFARFRMLDSPGFTPGELPLPAKVIDFADVTVLNPPWASDLDVALTPVHSRPSFIIGYTLGSQTNDVLVSTNGVRYIVTSETTEISWIYTGLPDGAAISNPPHYNEYDNVWRMNFYFDGSPYEGEAHGSRDATTLNFHASSGDADTPIIDFTATKLVLTRNALGLARLVDLPPLTNGLVTASTLTNYYTMDETDDAIDSLAAYYITMDAQGAAFNDYAALTNATVYYSGGALRTPTRNDYAVVLADETHGGAEWRYIYAVHEGATAGQWEAQYPIETNDYEALANKPSIGGFELSGNKSAADLGLATPQDVASATNELNTSWSSRLSQTSRDSTNYTDHAISTADTSYPRFTTATNLNQSVQYLTAAPNNILTIELPTGSAATKDWIVYAYFGAETVLALPAANWWMADESYTNAIPASTPTAFYFSQVADGIYTISRQELKTVSINE